MNKLYFTRVVEKTRGLFTSSPLEREREREREWHPQGALRTKKATFYRHTSPNISSVLDLLTTMDTERHSNSRERDKYKLAMLSSLQKPGNLKTTLVQSREFACPVPYYDWTLAG